MRSLGPVLRDAWRLFRPYFFRSDERWRALGVLIVVIAMNLISVGLSVILTFWRAQWYNSLQNKDWTAFFNLIFTWRITPGGHFMPGFCALAAVLVVLSVYSTWLQQWLQIHWRRWMTTHFLDRWMADQAYYRISLTADPNSPGMDNPDQRLSDDLINFTGGGPSSTSDTLSLGLDFISNVVSLFSYVAVLWALSGPITLFGVTIPGYMVFVVIVYAVLGTGLTHWVGRPLVRMRFWQQRLEADLRFGLVRVRENTEGIALYRGEDDEKRVLMERFGRVVGNYRDLMNRTKLVGALTGSYNQLAVIFPIVVAAPRYFAGRIPLGTLIQIGETFGNVQSSLSWFVNNYTALAAWRATVGRLGTFDRAISAVRQLAHGPDMVPGDPAGVELDDLTLTLPDGTQLLSNARLRFPRGEATVISGASGSGKSTLFRAIAGIWPFGSGRVRRSAGTYLFLPQRPYIPLGSLRRAVCYPAPEHSFGDAAISEALRVAGLGELTAALDADEHWAQRLSGGEQQRLAIARALLIRPDWLFLDEATASLDPPAEEQIYRLLRERLPQTTIVSIAHRPNLERLHDNHLVLERAAGVPGRLAAPQPA